MHGLHPAAPEDGTSTCLGSRAKEQSGPLRDEQGVSLRGGGWDQMVMDVLVPLVKFQAGGLSPDCLYQRPLPPAFLASAPWRQWLWQLAASRRPSLSSLLHQPVHSLGLLQLGCPGAEVAKKTGRGPARHLPMLESRRTPATASKGAQAVPAAWGFRPPLCPLRGLALLSGSWDGWATVGAGRSPSPGGTDWAKPETQHCLRN